MAQRSKSINRNTPFSAECSGTRTRLKRKCPGGRKGIQHQNCSLPQCGCLCHRKDWGSSHHIGDGVWEIRCRECGNRHRFKLSLAGFHRGKQLEQKGWTNSASTIGKAGIHPTYYKGWRCPKCSDAFELLDPSLFS